MDRRKWEQRNADIALYQVNQEFRSQRVEVLAGESMGRSGSNRKDEFICRELEVRNKLFQESRASNCQEIEEL